MAERFQDRVVQHPGRRKLTLVDGTTDTYEVERAEGTIYTAGTLVNAAALNALIDEAKSQLSMSILNSM